MMADAAGAVDLSALPRDTRVNLEICLTQGASWEWLGVDDPEPFCVLRLGGCIVAADGDGLIRHPLRYFGPDFPAIPAAWAVLMQKELVRWETGEWGDTREHRCAYVTDDGVSIAWGRWQPTLGAAAVQAVLEKHGVAV